MVAGTRSMAAKDLGGWAARGALPPPRSFAAVVRVPAAIPAAQDDRANLDRSGLQPAPPVRRCGYRETYATRRGRRGSVERLRLRHGECPRIGPGGYGDEV